MNEQLITIITIITIIITSPMVIPGILYISMNIIRDIIIIYKDIRKEIKK